MHFSLKLVTQLLLEFIKWNFCNEIEIYSL